MEFFFKCGNSLKNGVELYNNTTMHIQHIILVFIYRRKVKGNPSRRVKENIFCSVIQVHVHTHSYVPLNSRSLKNALHHTQVLKDILYGNSYSCSYNAISIIHNPSSSYAYLILLFSNNSSISLE